MASQSSILFPTGRLIFWLVGWSISDRGLVDQKVILHTQTIQEISLGKVLSQFFHLFVSHSFKEFFGFLLFFHFSHLIMFVVVIKPSNYQSVQ